MPVISVTLGRGQLNQDQKKQLIESFTTMAVEISKLPPQAFTILISELEHTNIGVGGISLEEKLRSS